MSRDLIDGGMGLDGGPGIDPALFLLTRLAYPELTIQHYVKVEDATKSRPSPDARVRWESKGG